MKLKFKSFSKNIIFFDSEFTSNDHAKAEMLSLGMVKMNGEELYIELRHAGPVSAWVSENILPTLNDEKISKRLAISKVKRFVGKDKPYLLAFIYPFDYLYLEKLLGWDTLQKIFDWPPIDFASILFGNNVNPERYYFKDKHNFFEQIGVDVSKYKLHKSIDDAKLLRDVYMKMARYE